MVYRLLMFGSIPPITALPVMRMQLTLGNWNRDFDRQAAMVLPGFSVTENPESNGHFLKAANKLWRNIYRITLDINCPFIHY